MSHSPRRDDPALNLESLSSEELERVIVSLTPQSSPAEESSAPPPRENKRPDAAHREFLRQPFFLER